MSNETTSLHEVAADYIDADDDIEDLERQLKEAKAHKKSVEDTLFAAMLDQGAPSVEVYISGSKNKAKIYPVSRLYARRDPAVEVEQFCAQMIEAGYGDLVKQSVNTNSLSAIVRELAEAAGVRDEGSTAILARMPDAMRGVIKISTEPVLSIKRS
jgi:hypothetical protein